MLANVDFASFSDFVRIEAGIGNRLTSFIIHASMLTTRAVFFKKALSGNWNETNERIIRFPDDEPEAVSVYLHHVYNGDFPVMSKPTSNVLIAIADIYIFAEKVQDIKCKNAVIEAMISWIYRPEDGLSGRPPSFETACIIYSGTPPDSMARKLLVDVFAYSKKPHWIQEKEWPEEFLHELAMKLMELTATCRFSSPAKSIGSEKYMEEEEDSEGSSEA